MSVVSVDLAYKRYEDIGVVVLTRAGSSVTAVPVRLASLGAEGVPEAARLAAFLASLAASLSAQFILIDGPQAWKDPANGLEHCRRCERALSTPGKTGLPGETKPGTYLDFTSFSIELFEQLASRGFPRLRLSDAWPERAAVESFPTAAWRALALRPLASKSKAAAQDVEDALRSLTKVVPVEVEGVLTHDEVQAVVGGLPGLSLEDRNYGGFELVGTDPHEVGGICREGYIATPTRHAIP